MTSPVPRALRLKTLGNLAYESRDVWRLQGWIKPHSPVHGLAKCKIRRKIARKGKGSGHMIKCLLTNRAEPTNMIKFHSVPSS